WGLRELSAEEALETIKNFAQGQKEWDKPIKAITEQELSSLRAQANELFGNENVWFEIPRYNSCKKCRGAPGHQSRHKGAECVSIQGISTRAAKVCRLLAIEEEGLLFCIGRDVFSKE
ncbi:hypothetical protein Tco_0497297, partial [Tanacetum coccineum]